MAFLSKFGIKAVSKKLNEINARISETYNKAFPVLIVLSQYRFKKKFVKIMPNGDIQGGLMKMIISLIDFSFIRSLTAHCYSVKSPPSYDPPSMFILEMIRYIDRYPSMDNFLEVLRDKDRGRAYRAYAGLKESNIPTKGTFSNFKARLGAELYNEIFHIIVSMFRKLGMISFNILAHDGTLYPTRARYKGCAYFSSGCSKIHIKNILFKVKRQIMYRLNNLTKVNLEKEFRIKVKCQCQNFPEDAKKPKIEVLALKLVHIDDEPSQNQTNYAILFGVTKELSTHKLGIQIVRSALTDIDPCDENSFFSCSKLPTDTDAKIGVRRDPKRPNKKEKIFGYNLILSTSVEPDLKLELPVAATTIAGNADEGKHIITNHQQIQRHHNCKSKLDIADAKYDIKENYQYLRDNGSIPIIDYNPRNENIKADDLKKRGYDKNGWPFAPCGLTTKFNGFDKKRQRHTFCCYKQCKTLKVAGINNIQADYDIGKCTHIDKVNGFTKHTYINDAPRLQNEIPRGSERFNLIKKNRSASERINSALKEDLKALDKPIVYCKKRADIIGQIVTIALLFDKAFSYISRTTMLLLKYNATKDPEIAKLLNPHFIPKAIRSIIQRE